MKKRAQFPDGHTYSIIFNGCSMHPSPDHALGKALPIYHSMSSEKSSIKPTVVHVNALLKLCARALNTEALLAIVAEMPSKGVGSPNNLTYTTVFNALRFFATGGMRDTLTPMLKRQNREKAMLEARHLWVDITKRWGQGDIFLDEELVSAFGRLLLLGGRRDIDDILSLIEQTMNIPRQVPRLGTEARQAVDPLASIPELTPNSDGMATANRPVLEQPGGDSQPELAAVDHFQALKPIANPGERRGVFAKPGQNSLSLVLEALLEMKLKEAAQKYWQVFTTQHNVRPDLENFHAYLRILRVARASNEATKVLQKMPIQDLKYSTFRIAMAACRRDKLNGSAFANGGRLLDLMQTALGEPDIPFLEDYLELAITAPAYSKKVSSSGENDWSKLEQGKQILRALERLNPSLLNLKAMLQFEDPELAKKTPHERTRFVDSILSLTRRMISCYDLLMDKAMVPQEFHKYLKEQRGKLSAFVARHKLLKKAEQDKSKGKGDNVITWSTDALAVLSSPEAIPSFELFENDTPPSNLKDRGLATKSLSQIQNSTVPPRILEVKKSKKRGAMNEFHAEGATFDEKGKKQLSSGQALI
jgi:Pentatricopeptide repeat domain